MLFGDCNFSLFIKPGSKGLMLLMLHVRAVFIVCQRISHFYPQNPALTPLNLTMMAGVYIQHLLISECFKRFML